MAQLTYQIFSETYLEIGIFITLETKFVNIVETKIEEMKITSVLLNPLPFLLIASMWIAMPVFSDQGFNFITALRNCLFLFIPTFLFL